MDNSLTICIQGMPNSSMGYKRIIRWVLVSALLAIVVGLVLVSFFQFSGDTGESTRTVVQANGDNVKQNFSLPIQMPIARLADEEVSLYGLFETQVINTNNYSNPFDYKVIELQADFTSPSGKHYAFFGFYDGDGQGGQEGNVWKLRFLPNEVGQWEYTYRWTDGTIGGSGSFRVVDTGLPGPLRIASDNNWFFEDSRGNPFHARGYALHQYLEGMYGTGFYSREAVEDLIDKINSKAADRDYNFLMLTWPAFTNRAGHHFWYQEGNQPDFNRYNIRIWREVERIIDASAQRRIYVIQFLAMVDQKTDRPNDAQMESFLRYMAARLGSYWNNLGYSPTWEFQDIWSVDYADRVMSQMRENLKGLPVSPLLSIHDSSPNAFSGWLDFSMRQRQSRNIFGGNGRSLGKHGGVGSMFLDRPILGSEDVWEYCDGSYGQPRNGTEVRRGAWGLLMAGVIPIYSETGLADSRAPCSGRSNFSGEGEAEIRRMFDFVYTKTRYRQYQQLNNIVSRADKQIASGVPGLEYLVYDENGGSIDIDLTGVPSSVTFSVLWYDPKTCAKQREGVVFGGAYRRLDSPFSQDTVLLLRGGNSPSGFSGANSPGAPAADISPVDPSLLSFKIFVPMISLCG